MLARIGVGFLALILSAAPSAAECPGAPRTVVGLVYCDNAFTLWVNGKHVTTDPVAFTPHQAVRVSFEWDGTSSLTYAIRCEDFASDSGYEYIASARPQLGDGALIAEFDDGLGIVSEASSWRVYTVTFGPTDASRIAGCAADNLGACVVEDRGTLLDVDAFNGNNVGACSITGVSPVCDTLPNLMESEASVVERV